jgi:TonB family protein
VRNWQFWLELFARSGVLLLAGEILRRASKTSGAAFRHRLLVWVFVLLACLPLLSVFFPEIPLSLWRPRPAIASSVTVEVLSSRMREGGAHHSLDWLLAIWTTGFLIAMAPLALGAVWAWRISRRATAFRAFTGVLLSSELRVPITCGLLRPRILLPAAAASWSSSRLEAVFLHESAHIRRRDLATQVGAHIVAALWWFQPLVWVLRSRLRSESELACDAEAVRSGFRASSYAAELLAVAQHAGESWRLSSPSIGMARARGLEERLQAILRPPLGAFGRPKTYGIGLALAAVSIAAAAVTLNPSRNLEEQGGSIMKRTILSALLTSAGLSAATVSGYIHDSNGAAIADAKVIILNPDNAAKQESTTSSDGKFSFSGSDAGQYILRIEKSGMASIFRVFDLKADSKMDRDFTMAAQGTPVVMDDRLAPVVMEDSSIAPSEKQPKPIRVGGEVAQNNLTTKVPPVYPMAAKKAHIQGQVQLDVTISKEGVPVDLQVVSSPNDDLSESALEAVRQWRYRATLLNGNPVEIETLVIVNYTLSQ